MTKRGELFPFSIWFGKVFILEIVCQLQLGSTMNEKGKIITDGWWQWNAILENERKS